VAQTLTPQKQSPAPLRKPPKKLPYPLNLMQTAVGRKWVMALSGIGLIGFVLAHMAGNLKIYQGEEKFRDYAEVLREIGEPVIPHGWFLWILRFGLIAMFFVHIYAAMSLTQMARSSNGGSTISGNKSYAGSQDFIAASYASRTMRWTGPIILLFLVWHLMDLTWGWVNPDFVKGQPYNNLEASLSSLPIAIIYIAANIALAIHIYHGTWSLFASLGITGSKINLFRKPLAAGLAALILVGNLSFPLLTQLNVIDEQPLVAVIEGATK